MTDEEKPLTARRILLYAESIYDEQAKLIHIYHIKLAEMVNNKITGKFRNYLINPKCELGAFDDYNMFLLMALEY